MTAYVQEFTQEGKNFLFIDFSSSKTAEEFFEVICAVKPVISKYPEGSVYTVTQVGLVHFDSEVVGMISDYLEHNKPYVKHGAVCGSDGVKKIFVTSMLAKTKRSKMGFFHTKEQAILWLLEQD